MYTFEIRVTNKRDLLRHSPSALSIPIHNRPKDMIDFSGYCVPPSIDRSTTEYPTPRAESIVTSNYIYKYIIETYSHTN